MSIFIPKKWDHFDTSSIFLPGGAPWLEVGLLTPQIIILELPETPVAPVLVTRAKSAIFRPLGQPENHRVIQRIILAPGLPHFQGVSIHTAFQASAASGQLHQNSMVEFVALLILLFVKDKMV